MKVQRMQPLAHIKRGDQLPYVIDFEWAVALGTAESEFSQGLMMQIDIPVNYSNL